MHADILPQDEAIFVILHDLHTRIAIFSGHVGSIYPAKSQIARSRSIARVIVQDRLIALQRNSAVGIANTDRIIP